MATAELLRDARFLIENPPSRAPSLWGRAALLLARQSLEESLEQFWLGRSPDLVWAPMRGQLLCLGEVMKDHETARAVANLWNALSDACHYDAYDLIPNSTEIAHWLNEAEELCEVLDRRAGNPSS